MGLLDALKKKLSKAQTAENAAAEHAERRLTATGEIPAKPSIQRESSFAGYLASFMLSGDFIAFNSHSEWDPAFQYEPENDQAYTAFKDGYPQIFIGPLDEAYTAAENYVKRGEQTGSAFEAINDGTFLFRTVFSSFGQILYAYVFAEDTTQAFNVFGLLYDRDFRGTPLEAKLKAALDEAAATYVETKSE